MILEGITDIYRPRFSIHGPRVQSMQETQTRGKIALEGLNSFMVVVSII